MTYRLPAWQTLAFTIAAAAIASAAFAFSRPVELRVDGRTLASDVSPIATAHAGVYVPLRALADALGADTTVEDKGRSVTVVRGDRALRIKVGDTHAKLNGMPMTLREAPFRVRGRVMIGMKSFANALGVRGDYDARDNRVDFTSSGVVAVDRSQ
jgi:hypothetical protein